MRRTTTVVAAAVLALVGATAAAPAPAGAAAVKHFTEITGPRVAVSGTYVPIVGHFTDNLREDIIWYAPGTGADRFWRFTGGTDLWTKEPLVPQVNGRYTPIVGDFGGTGLDDILWHSSAPGGDHLWVRRSDNQGFRSVDLPDDGTPVVLRAPNGGPSKDDILWLTAGTDFLWRFTDDRSVSVLSSTPMDLPKGTARSGDFDGDGDPDVLLYQAGPAADTLLRRNGAEGTSFTSSTLTVDDYGLVPVVGRFDAGIDPTDDIAWFRTNTDPYQGTQGATIWRGQSDGTFSESTSLVARTGHPVIRRVGWADQIISPALPDSPHPPDPDNYDSLWQTTTDGPERIAIDNLGAPRGAIVFAGRFRSDLRDDLFVYQPGAGAERLLS